MALGTFAQLGASIESWLDRDDIPTDDLITLAEEAISADLAKCPVMHVSPSPITLSSGDTSFSLAADAAELLSARLVELDTELEIVPVADLKRGTLSTTQTGIPGFCSMSGSGDSGTLTVLVWPIPEDDYTVQVLYAASVPALATGTQDTNFVLTRAPSLYLFGALLAAAPFLGQDPRIATWQVLYDRALSRFVSRNWSGDVRLRTDVPMPMNGGQFNINTGW